ncbi:hypothetical protein [Planomonospora venezuelensis]|uniref:Uncharacterized protein n=1 Tax=Planomonospora venezuelensis TaxID=1999 RepID=A0A841D866_PLAVE|nr:hypothetical protein [Planomonospora venezuelensis]MBB5965669.1 hypothetical protein [Planomonospora venezuelensis]
MTGMLIGAVFGTVFVVVNANSPLDATAGAILRGAAVLGLAGVVVMWFLAVRRIKTGAVRAAGPDTTGPGAAGRFFGLRYAFIVAAEAVLLFGGIAVLRVWERPEQTNVAWIAFVVGVHFVALAPVWGQRSILVVGVVLALLGTAGLIMAATSAVAWVPFVSGVLSGAVLLAGSLTFARQELAAPAAQDRTAS